MRRSKLEIQSSSGRTNTKIRKKPSKNLVSQSIRGLITEKQQKMKQNIQSQGFSNSQGTQYTHLTGKTRSNLDNEEMDFIYDQLEKQEMREVFINRQQEKVIHTILDIARKGKINQKNAFEIPIKLANQQVLNPSLNKFWKFASQLLGASIHIYDKRIQNTWNDTNKIHDKLARINLEKGKNSRQSDLDQDDFEFGKNTSDNIDMLMLPIQQFRKFSLTQGIKLGEYTLQDPQKINIRKFIKNYNADPLFSKKQMTFDNSSNNSLLMNVFEMGKACDIKMFTNGFDKTKAQSIQELDSKIKQNFPQKNSQNMQLINQILEESNQFTYEISKKIQQCSLQTSNANKNTKDHELISLKQQTPENVLRNQQLDKILQQQFQNFSIIADQNLYVSALNEIGQDENINFTNNTQEPTHLGLKSFNQSQPENLNRENFDFEFQSQGYSANNTFQEYFSSQNSLDHSFHSVMTPWQMQFKNGKLQRKKGQRQRNTNRKKRQKIQAGQVDFNALIVEHRDKVLAIKPQKTKKSVNNSKPKKNSIQNSNLVPPQMVVYEKYNYAKVKDIQKQKNTQCQDDKQIASFLAPDPSMLSINPTDHPSKLQPISQGHQIQNQNFRSSDKFQIQTNPNNPMTFFNFDERTPVNKQMNIRELKKRIYELVSDERQIRLSEINIDVDPSNILITFLHLANQKNLVVRDIQQQSDVLLAWQ